MSLNVTLIKIYILFLPSRGGGEVMNPWNAG